MKLRVTGTMLGTLLAGALTVLVAARWRPRPAAAAEAPLCPFAAGAHPAATLGLEQAQRRAIPIAHIIVVMQENRSFDHYFGRLPAQGQPKADGIPPGSANADHGGRRVPAHHLATTCVAADPPHQWDAMHTQWNEGRMDGFVRNLASEQGDGADAMGYYDASDLPFYYWLARTFAISDRHFSSVMGGTWHNRQFLYAATSRWISADGRLRDAPTIFDALDRAGVGWRIYAEGGSRQDCLGWTLPHAHVVRFEALVDDLARGTLPAVAFVDPWTSDEHPPHDVQMGEAWFRRIYLAVTASPLWPKLALFLTYDEAGGFFDHVSPPLACPPAADRAELDRLGMRIPLLLVSPWARPGQVSHETSEHTSLLKLIELVHDLPALSARDANAGALLDLFDFSSPRLLRPQPPPTAGRGGCRSTPPAITRR